MEFLACSLRRITAKYHLGTAPLEILYVLFEEDSEVLVIVVRDILGHNNVLLIFSLLQVAYLLLFAILAVLLNFHFILDGLDFWCLLRGLRGVDLNLLIWLLRTSLERAVFLVNNFGPKLIELPLKFVAEWKESIDVLEILRIGRNLFLTYFLLNFLEFGHILMYFLEGFGKVGNQLGELLLLHSQGLVVENTFNLLELAFPQLKVKLCED